MTRKKGCYILGLPLHSFLSTYCWPFLETGNRYSIGLMFLYSHGQKQSVNYQNFLNHSSFLSNSFLCHFAWHCQNYWSCKFDSQSSCHGNEGDLANYLSRYYRCTCHISKQKLKEFMTLSIYINLWRSNMYSFLSAYWKQMALRLFFCLGPDKKSSCWFTKLVIEDLKSPDYILLQNFLPVWKSPSFYSSNPDAENLSDILQIKTGQGQSYLPMGIHTSWLNIDCMQIMKS